MRKSGDRRHAGQILLAAASAILLSSSAFGQLYFDTNGTTTKFGSPTTGSQAVWGTWSASNTITDWNTSSAGTGTSTVGWVSGDVANFVSADPTGKGAQVNLSGTPIIVGGLTFSGEPTTIGGASGTGLDFGSGNTTITDAVNAKQIIDAPIAGSGTITITTTLAGSAGAVDFAGYSDYSSSSTATQFAGFTGNLVATNGAPTPSTTNFGTLYVDSSLGGTSSTITLNPFMELADSFYTSGFYTPSFTLSTPIILNNANSVAGATYTIAAISGSGAVEHSETYTGVISSSGSPINLQINGNGGNVILGAANTYSGSTYITTPSTGGGIVQLGVDNAIPASSALNFGPASGGSPTVGPFDLNGHNLTVAGLSTQTNLTASNNNGGVDVGNIYNTSTNGSAPNTVTLTINVPTGTNQFYKGDIGDTNLNASPYNLNAPFLNSTQPGTNINVVINGPGTQTLDPVPNQSKGDEYTGTTTVNGGTLVLGRGGNSDTNAMYTGGPGFGLPGGYYTLSSSNVGDITVNNGGTLASVKSDSQHFVGGSAGNINLLSGSQFLPGTAGNVGAFVTNNLNVDSGASMTFDLASNTSFDYVVILGTLTLDSTGQHTVNINKTGSTLYAGTYTLIQSVTNYFNWDGTNGFALGTTPTGTGDNFALSIYDNFELQLTVTAPVLQWDPTNSGPTSANGTINEGGGTWTSSSTFYDYGANPPADIAYANAPINETVEFGNDVTQNGGQVVLGQNITVASQLQFGPIAAGHNYDIVDPSGGPAYTLTIGGGINVLNAAASSTTPSAQIDAPIVLSGTQTWNIPVGQVLTVTNIVTESDSPTLSDTLTVTGAGTLDLYDTSGNTSFAALDINGGTVLLGAYNSIGSVPVTLDGGGLEEIGTGTLTNAITVGTSGGGIGTTTGLLTVNQNLGGATAGTFDVFGSGSTTLNGILNFKTFETSSSGTTTLTNASNTIGAIELYGGSLQVPSAAQLGGATSISLSGSNNGSLLIPGVSSLPANLNSGAGGSFTFTIDTTPNGGTTPLTLSGSLAGAGNFTLSGVEFTLSGNNSYTGIVNLVVENEILHTTSATALGAGTLNFNADATLDVQTSASTGAIHAGTAGMTLTKIGAGTLTLNSNPGGTSVVGATFVDDQGDLVLDNSYAMGSKTNSLDIIMNSGTTLHSDFTNAGRVGGTLTLNSATIVHDETGSDFDEQYSAGSAADVWTINGNSKIQNAEILTSATNFANFTITNPVVVSSGAVLTAEDDNTFGYPTQDALNFRGPTSVSTAGYDDFVIQAGGTVINTGPGEVQYGRNTTQGIAIIGQGMPGSDAVMKMNAGVWMTDIAATSQIFTTLVVDGSGNAGLRIESAMNATYIDPSTNPPVGAPIGTNGLFGVDNYSTNTNGNVYTVFSPNRAMALSSTYSDGTNTFTPGGTLTLAATDASGATGTITAGPASQCAVTLAVANGTGSGGTLTYVINPASPDGGNFANFAGLTVEQDSAVSSASVVAQLMLNQGTTKVPALTISGGAKLDITNQGLAVDPANGPAPTAQIAGYLKSAYDNGAWDLGGIGSSQISALVGTSIGYAENDLLPAAYQFNSTTNLFGGQQVDVNAVLVKYTWMGDLDLDGTVDSEDLALMDAGDGSSWMQGDLNYDDVKNADDWSLFFLGEAAYSAHGTLTSAVPEPAAASLLVASAGMMLRRRRRIM